MAINYAAACFYPRTGFHGPDFRRILHVVGQTQHCNNTAVLTKPITGVP